MCKRYCCLQQLHAFVAAPVTVKPVSKLSHMSPAAVVSSADEAEDPP